MNNELSKNKKSGINLLEMGVQLLVIAFLFSGPFLNCFLYFFKREASSGQLAILYIFIAIASLALLVVNGNRFIRKKIVIIALIIFFLSILFLITETMYGENALFRSELRAYYAVSVNIILILLLITQYKIYELSLRMIFVLEIVLTIVITLVIFRANGITTGGLLQDSSGFLYQNTSYYAAYAFGMGLFLQSERKFNSIQKFNIFYLLNIFLSLFQFVLCLLSGGRGGVALAVVLLFYYITVHKGIRSVLYIIAIVFFVYLSIPILLNFLNSYLDVNAIGLERVLESFANGINDSNRQKLRSLAWSFFLESPVFGHGIGSIFYFIGTYSHNLFTDMLAETGVIGFILFCLILIGTLHNAKKLFCCGSLYRFLLMTFLCGFTMCLFSGYVWVNQQIWLPISASYILLLDNNTN